MLKTVCFIHSNQLVIKIKKRHTLGYLPAVMSFSFLIVPSAEVFLTKHLTDYQLFIFFMCRICGRNKKII